MLYQPKVLIIEDDVSQRTVLQKRLSQDGYNVSVAVDGVTGLAKAFEEKPNLIILDLLMPNKDGEAVLRELKADPWGKKVHVLILTNYGDFSRVMKAYNLGADLFLTKSNTSLDEISEKIREKLLQINVF